ncbi:MAG: hypothetical protein SGJ24_08770 [Chloroflexota bacterium]|nr:hypothetical protein [Chloroflexota bacterium]
MTDMPPVSPAAELPLGAQRAATCPIKPCRGADDNDTLLRSIRSDRLLCMYCVTRTPTGYIGKEEARATEAKFYKATQTDYIVQFAVCVVGAGAAAVLSQLFGVFLFVFFIGAAVGGAVGTLARRLTARRLGRYSGEIGIAGVAVGTLLAPIGLALIRTGRILPGAAIDISSLICGVVVGIAVYAIMKGRI